MGTDAANQIAAQPRALYVAGGAAIAIALIPGLPKIPFLLVGIGAVIMAQRLSATAKAKATAPGRWRTCRRPAMDTPEAVLSSMSVDVLEIVLAADLVDLVDTSRGGDLLDRVRGLRRKVADELGLVMPPVRTRDSLDLAPASYSVRISGVEVAEGRLPAGHILAIGEDLAALPGQDTREPVFGLAAKWVPTELRQQAELYGATVVDRSSVLITHLGEVVRQHASRLLGREDVRALLDHLKRTHPVVVEELTPALMTTGEVQRVLQALLDEQVPIRDLVRIFEALSLRAKVSTDLDGLVEAARLALGPALAAVHARGGLLQVLTLDPIAEQQLVESVRPGDLGAGLALPPGHGRAAGRLGRLAAARRRGHGPLAGPGLRRPAARAAQPAAAHQLLPPACPVVRRDRPEPADRDVGSDRSCRRTCCLRVRTSSPCWPACARTTARTPRSSRPSWSGPAASPASSPSAATRSPSRSTSRT